LNLSGSYTDPDYLGLIISPVADCDLLTQLSNVPLSPDKEELLYSAFGCLCTAVAYLHENKIRHKDIKPQNILIKGKTFLLTDFGLSLDWAEMSRRTTEGTSRKTPRYCAPEVANYEPRNWSSDIWSLGCVYLEIITVLKGKTLQALKSFFQGNGSESQSFQSNQKATERWLAELRVIRGPAFANTPLEWIPKMLRRDRHQRPSASALFQLILSAKSCQGFAVRFYGTCCMAEDPIIRLEDPLSADNDVIMMDSSNRTELKESITGAARLITLLPRPTPVLQGVTKPEADTPSSLFFQNVR
jgi:serine/threonine protein kinase